jgi:hypothetical protein
VADLDELGAEQERIARQHAIAQALLSRGASGGLINLYSGNQMMEKGRPGPRRPRQALPGRAR